MIAAELAQDALSRAQSGMSTANYSAIFHGFMAKGIPEADILPRENVLTFWAWKAKGRSVRKGEHGVHILTFVPCSREKTDATTGERRVSTFRRPKGATVFHVSQTDPIL